ncbi:MAG TPA: hydroxyproline-2-epimerase [Planctomycetaceae bacterium]|nr:hydroxyproline-2-epimerase [Planctomycetaceae bacterium]
MRIVDSHTAGEPTRVVIADGPNLGSGSLIERRLIFRDRFDHYRRLAIHEPRGSDAIVGALLCEPDEPACDAAVIFFNNCGVLNMCGHGIMGVAATLAYLERVKPGVIRIQTPVGTVDANLLTKNEVAVENIPSYRYRKQVTLQIEELGTITGDIAWGGNWFFLVEQSPVPVKPEYIRQLSDASALMRKELREQQITGTDGEEIDHIELYGTSESEDAHSRNFVYCPGGAYDRSPCGTGTSAKLACLAADGKLKPGEEWIQESIIGSRFVATYRIDPELGIIPTIRGSAYICGEGRLIQQDGDPFGNGIDMIMPSEKAPLVRE